MPAMHAKRKDEWTAERLINALGRLHMSSADLTALIQLTHQFASEQAEQKLHALKASRDGAALPLEILRREVTKQGECFCRCALRLCDDNSDGVR